MRTRLLLCLVAAVVAPLSSSCKDDPPPPPPPECGNGLLEEGETCEGMPPPEGCNAESCTVTPGWACTPEVSGGSDGTSGGPTLGTEVSSTCEMLDTCGDGVIDVGEACDDGNTNVMDGCSGCMVDPQYTCTGQPSECHTCGDGFRNPGEECDDGELIGQGSAGCENCLVVEGWSCFEGDSADLCGPECGDGIWLGTPLVTVGFAEQCDDGNLVSGDGCDASCDVEDGCECMGELEGTSTCFCGGDDSGTSTGMDTDTGSGSGSGSGSDTGMGSSGTSTG